MNEMNNRNFLIKSISPFLAILILGCMFSGCLKKENAMWEQVSKNPQYPNVKLIKNVKYSNNKDWKGNDVALKMDIYIPDRNTKATKYPLYVWMHGGAWLNGSKDAGLNGATGAYLNGMANVGYVTVSIDYRLGWESIGKDCNLQDSVTAKNAIYRSIQDQHAAIRFLIANADKYNIDTNYIFIGGSSAGAGSSLYSAFFTQQIFDQSSPRLRSELGTLDRANNLLTTQFKLSGVVNQWGAIEDTNVIQNGYNALPVLSFAGMKDDEVPWKYGHWRFCSNLQNVYGSADIYERIHNLELTSMCYIKRSGGHVTFSPDFWIEKTDIFFKSVISGEKKDEFL